MLFIKVRAILNRSISEPLPKEEIIIVWQTTTGLTSNYVKLLAKTRDGNLGFIAEGW